MKPGQYNQAIRVSDTVIRQEPKNRQAWTSMEQAHKALLAKIAQVSSVSDIQTCPVKEK